MSATETLLSRAKRLTKCYVRDEDGVVIAYIVLVFLLMVLATGSAIDYMRHESMRAELQSGIDRGLLAAASLTQTMTPEQVVIEYLKSSPNLNLQPSDIQVVMASGSGINSRHMDARATIQRPSFFLRLIGVDALTVSVHGAAMEQRNEISLVLDISPSMADNNKMTTLKSTAKNFVDQLINANTTRNSSMTIVPYGGHVSMGPTLFNLFPNIQGPGGASKHSYSHCIDFQDSDFDVVGFDHLSTREQVAHFRFGYSVTQQGTFVSPYPAGTGWGWCPDDVSAIEPLSNDATELKTAIDNMGMHEATGIQNGLKWGTIFLDSQAQPLVNKLIALNEVDPLFAGRPSSSTAANQKFLILMTDGRITKQLRIKDSLYNADRAKWATRPMGDDSSNYTTLTTRDESYEQMIRLCTAAKAQGIRIFTIAFELTPPTGSSQALIDEIKKANDKLKECSSDATTDYFDVSTSNLGLAFTTIANTIKKLRLVKVN